MSTTNSSTHSIHGALDVRLIIGQILFFGLLLWVAAPAASANEPAPVFVSEFTAENVVSTIRYQANPDGGANRRAQIHIERSPDGADWSDPVNASPYYRATVPVLADGTIVFRPPRGAFQGGYTYRMRVSQWRIGGFTATRSPWSLWHRFSIERPALNPVAPYPLSPTGVIGQSGIVLRTDNSSMSGALQPNPLLPPSYEFELKTAHNPYDSVKDSKTLWTRTVPAGNAGDKTEVSLTCGEIPGCQNGVLPRNDGYSFRWRVRTIDNGFFSYWSRWRYFSSNYDRSEYWYIPNRVGSYQAGLASGDEASGLVASKRYPGVYWFIRDAGENEDRAKIYAIKINKGSHALDNIDGYVTKEIKVNGATNVDWESITLDDQGNLWIGDIGDYYRKAGQPGRIWDRNNSSEPDVRLYRMREPNPYTADAVNVTKEAPFRYPDGKTYNAEAIFAVGNRIFLVTKSEKDTQRIFRFPSYIDRDASQNILREVGTLRAGLDPVTGADITNDGSRLALTTASKKALIFEGPGGPSDTSWEATTLVRNLLHLKDPAYEYYYRSAAALAADGRLQDERGHFSPGAQERLLTMQVEGAAWGQPAEYQQQLAMISEFGKHTLNALPHGIVPADGWMGRQWVDRSCEPELTCTIDYIYSLSLQRRTDWFKRWIVEEHGESVGFANADGNWFTNIESVLAIAPGKFENNRAFNLIDSFILQAVQDGLRSYLTGSTNIDPEYGENLGGAQWEKFFESLQGDDYDEQRRNWGVAEQLATNHGREAAADNNWSLDEKTRKLLVEIGDEYRRLVAHPDEARAALRPVAASICGLQQEPGLFCVSDFVDALAENFDPRTPGDTFSLLADRIWGIGDILVEIVQWMMGLNGQWTWPCNEPDVDDCGAVPAGY